MVISFLLEVRICGRWEGEVWVELFQQSDCSACPGWLHQLAFAFLSYDKRTKPPTEELPAGGV